MKRRQFLTLLPFSGLAFTGCSRLSGKSIETMTREYSLLKDAQLRRQTMGENILTIKGADFGSEDFYACEWENVYFEDCVFYGRTRLKLLKNARFEHCQFAGDFQAKGMDNVLFLKSDTLGETYLMGGYSSKTVRFEECDFGGTNPDRNHFGYITMWGGDVVYEKCTGQYMGISGRGSSVTWRNCQFKTIDLKSGNNDLIAKKKTYARVLLDNVTCRGNTEMRSTYATSLTIRNSTFNFLGLNNAEVEGDFVCEKVKARGVKASFKKVKNITLRESTFTGIPVDINQAKGEIDKVIDCFSQSGGVEGVQNLLIEGLKCASLPVSSDHEKGGKGLWFSSGAISTVIRNSKIPRLSLGMHGEKMEFDGLEAEDLDLTNNIIGELSFKRTSVLKELDLTQTQVQKIDVQGLIRGPDLKILNTGSNVRQDLLIQK